MPRTSAADLDELERMLVESDVGAVKDINRAKKESRGLGLFVRSLVGMGTAGPPRRRWRGSWQGRH